MSKSEEPLYIGTADDFEQFLSMFETDAFLLKVSSALKKDQSLIQKRLTVYLNEMRFGYSFLKSRLPRGKMRILEVGAGLGLLSIYLHKQGHDVVALEPSATAFGMFEILQKEIWSMSPDELPQTLEKGAEELSREDDGMFDFIFSINVMEHISQLDEAFAAISNVLKEQGVWVNSCPNYHFPYEPHYALPLIPFVPKVSRALFYKKIDSEPETWNTLNFITWFKVKSLSKKNGMNVQFEKATLYESLIRIGKDSEFAKRHKSGLVAKTYVLLRSLGLLHATQLIPAAIATPMIFKLMRK